MVCFYTIVVEVISGMLFQIFVVLIVFIIGRKKCTYEVFLFVCQGEDLFKSDPFKSDLPASGEANGTATGISNGKSRVSDEVNPGCFTFALICFLIIVLAHFSFFHTPLTYDWLKNHALLSRPIRS